MPKGKADKTAASSGGNDFGRAHVVSVYGAVDKPIVRVVDNEQCVVVPVKRLTPEQQQRIERWRQRDTFTVHIAPKPVAGPRALGSSTVRLHIRDEEVRALIIERIQAVEPDTKSGDGLERLQKIVGKLSRRQRLAVLNISNPFSDVTQAQTLALLKADQREYRRWLDDANFIWVRNRLQAYHDQNDLRSTFLNCVGEALSRRDDSGRFIVDGPGVALLRLVAEHLAFAAPKEVRVADTTETEAAARRAMWEADERSREALKKITRQTQRILRETQVTVDEDGELNVKGD